MNAFKINNDYVISYKHNQLNIFLCVFLKEIIYTGVHARASRLFSDALSRSEFLELQVCSILFPDTFWKCAYSRLSFIQN